MAVVVCPRCEKEKFVPASELAEAQREALRALPGRQAQDWEHRLENHMVCTACWLEVHG